MLLLTVFVGHVADRYDHRIILMLCQITEGCGAAILVYATATGSLGTPVIYVVVAVVGSARAFEIPTMAAIISGAGAARGRAFGDGVSPPPIRPGRSSARRLAACSTCWVRRRVMASPSCCGGSAASCWR